mmetsp:Transcript_22423/g.70117  ORF Transcript_22423/g.70117 Transcript_22423/m.70117 type:complete len:422 (+) Transcript_22423:2-1267(+)
MPGPVATGAPRTMEARSSRARSLVRVLFLLGIASRPALALDGAGLGRLTRSAQVARWMAARPLVDQLLMPTRTVKVWLPPAYRTHKTARFPVLYAHDGQNVIHDHESWTGHSWRLTAALSAMIAEGLLPPEAQPIVVAIDNTGRRRHLEYSDSPPGDAYLDFVCEGIKPRIDAEFRTRSEPEHTHAIGASLGGLCAFRSVWTRPAHFGNCAALSPVFQPPLVMDVAMNGHRLKSTPGGRVYIDNGGDTDEEKVALVDFFDGPNPGYFWLDTQLQPGVDAMKAVLELHNLDFGYHRAPGGRHNERGWASRIRLPLEHLFCGAEAARVKPSAWRDGSGSVAAATQLPQLKRASDDPFAQFYDPAYPSNPEDEQQLVPYPVPSLEDAAQRMGSMSSGHNSAPPLRERQGQSHELRRHRSRRTTQ